jgi:hypothetical protein
VDIERHNHRQIEQLNQRGGRTLTIVDLIRDGTLSVPMAACALRAIEQGASLLTAARPGGAGKTTLMASILHLLPPGVRIVTVDGPEVLDALGAGLPALGAGLLTPPLERPEVSEATEERSPIRDDSGDPGDLRSGGRRGQETRAERVETRAEPRCYLVHEIGDGHWYGYLWGPDVARFLSLIDGSRRIASCLHADTLDELTAILGSPPLGVAREALARVGLILFMHVRRTRAGYQRRVATFYQSDGQGGHRLLFQWVAQSDTFRQTAALPDPDGLSRYAQFVQDLVDTDTRHFEPLRRKVHAFYGQNARKA